MMTENEVKRIWRNRAHTNKAMIGILADLNACTQDAMIEYLQLIGIDIGENIVKPDNRGRNGRPSWTEEEELFVVEKLNQRWPFTEIARNLKRSAGAVRQHYYDYISKHYGARE